MDLSPKKQKQTLLLSKSKEFKFFKKLIQQSKKILVSTHMLPDGDGLGAEVALYHYLKNSKKSCRVYNPDPLPDRYVFLDTQNKFLYGPKQAKPWNQFDLWVIVDTNDPRRLGPLWSELSLKAKKIVFLDHHPVLNDKQLNFSYPPHAMVLTDLASSSIGELLYHLFSELKLTSIQKDIALGLYVSVMTDTNSFRYARTTPMAHQIAGEMIELNVNPEEIYQSIFSSKQLSHIKLLGHMLQNVKTTPDGKTAWLEVSLELMKKHKASADDTLSFLNLLLLVKEAEIICLFREETANQIRVSIRSKGKHVINKIAAELGGGGHDYSAGASLKSSMDDAVNAIIKRLNALTKTRP